MPDVMRVAALFVDHVKRTCADEVALIAYYGSHARGTASAASDLDLYYIPDDGKAQGLYRSFVFDELPFEFWPLSWDFAEKIASGRHAWSVAPALLMEARILHARSEADLARFEGLKTRIVDLQRPERKPDAVKLAAEQLGAVALPLEALRLSCDRHDLQGARQAGFDLVSRLIDCLTLLNQVFWPKFWTACPERVYALPLRPHPFEPLVTMICTSHDLPAVRHAAETLVERTRVLLARELQSFRTPSDASVEFKGYYAAIKEYVQKVREACQRHDLLDAAHWASKMQQEMAETLSRVHEGFDSASLCASAEYRQEYDKRGFPDLTQSAAAGDLDALAEQAGLFDARARAYFSEQGVNLRSPRSFEELQAFMGQTW